MIAGCGPSFDPASSITKPRILGAKVQLSDDSTIAWPEPGEQVHLEWLGVDPLNTPAFEWGFGTCVAAPTLSGGQLCQATPFDLVESQGQTPVYDFTVPDAGMLSNAQSLLVAGALCAHGQLSIQGGSSFEDLGSNPDVFKRLEEAVQCEGLNAERILVSLLVPLKTSDEQNHHPDMTQVPIHLGDDIWSLQSGDATNTQEACASQEESVVPRVPADGDEVTLGLHFDGREREFYHSTEMGDTEARELLQLSHFATAGSLSDEFSVIESDAGDDNVVELSWEPPSSEKVPAQGMLVHFYFVARDRRGGVDWTVRSICVPSVLE